MNDLASIDHSLAEGQALVKSGDFFAAETLMQDVLLDEDLAVSNRRDALYTLAVSQRYQEKLEPALESLKELRQLVPDFGRGYQELGHTFLSGKRI